MEQNVQVFFRYAPPSPTGAATTWLKLFAYNGHLYRQEEEGAKMLNPDTREHRGQAIADAWEKVQEWEETRVMNHDVNHPEDPPELTLAECLVDMPDTWDDIDLIS